MELQSLDSYCTDFRQQQQVPTAHFRQNQIPTAQTSGKKHEEAKFAQLQKKIPGWNSKVHHRLYNSHASRNIAIG
jgi:hypothetical protein